VRKLFPVYTPFMVICLENRYEPSPALSSSFTLVIKNNARTRLPAAAINNTLNPNRSIKYPRAGGDVIAANEETK